MQGKKLIRDMINTYFMLVTMIVGVMAVLGMNFMPEARFAYKDFFVPLKYAAYATLPNVIMYATKELTVKQFLIRKVLQLILIEIIVITVALPMDAIKAEDTQLVVSLSISIVIIYLLTHLIDWFQNYTTAKQMTEELLRFQKNVSEE